MTARIDLVLQKHPEHEEGVRLLASRDPSSNLKYLDWGAKMLSSGQALAPEIADVLDLFHKFNGQWLGNRPPGHHHVRSGGNQHVRPDIHSYRPQDLAALRDLLLKLKRGQDRKRKKRERLYRIEGAIEANTVYDSDDLIVRHIKNKQASVHYGLGTKWCISMLREGYFEDYETHNATFFFFERKAPIGDEFDKVCLMVPRSAGRDRYPHSQRDESAEAFTALDLHVDMMALAKVYGSRVFDIFREIHECSERYPGSATSQVYAGCATREQLEAVFASIVAGTLPPHETRSLLEATCCNDAAPQALLEEVLHRAATLSLASWKKRSRRSRRPGKFADRESRELTRTVTAALTIHPQIPADAREALIKNLRRRRVDIESIHRAVGRDGRVETAYEMVGWPGSERGRLGPHGRRRRRHYRHPHTVKGLRAHAKALDRWAARTRKKARTLQRKLTEAKKKKERRARVLTKRKRR